MSFNITVIGEHTDERASKDVSSYSLPTVSAFLDSSNSTFLDNVALFVGKQGFPAYHPLGPSLCRLHNLGLHLASVSFLHVMLSCCSQHQREKVSSPKALFAQSASEGESLFAQGTLRPVSIRGRKSLQSNSLVLSNSLVTTSICTWISKKFLTTAELLTHDSNLTYMHVLVNPTQCLGRIKGPSKMH
jgi:hypothetical protein